MKKLFILSAVLISETLVNAQNTEPEYVANFPIYHYLAEYFLLVVLLIAAVAPIALLYYQNKAYNYTASIHVLTNFITGLLAVILFHAHSKHNKP